MVSLGELIVVVSFLWIILIAIANRVDLQQYGILVSSGFLLYIPDFFKKLLHRFAKPKSFWNKLGEISSIPMFVLFLAAPLLLSINLIKGIFFEISPIFDMNIIDIIRIENFLLILPVIMIFLSIQMLIMGIFSIINDEKLDRAGLLLIGVILTFFISKQGALKPKQKTKAISVIVISQLLLVGLAFPISNGIQSGMDNLYKEPEGAIIVSIYPNSPADDSNLEVSMIIKRIIIPTEDLNIIDLEVTSSVRFNRILAQIPADTEFIIETNSSKITIQGITPPSDVNVQVGSYLGLITVDYRPSKVNWITPLMPFWIDLFFDWIINIGLLFGFYSLLPMPRTQGYEMMEIFVEKFDLDIPLKARQILSVLAILLFGANIAFYVL